MKTTKRFLSTAALALAITLTLSCSDDKNDGENTGGSSVPMCGGIVIDPATEYCSNGTKKTYGLVADDDGEIYQTVVIGTQTWMAKNLNYNVSGSECYGEGGAIDDNGTTLSNAEIQANCAKYGRLYNWSTAKTVTPNTALLVVADFGGALAITIQETMLHVGI